MADRPDATAQGPLLRLRVLDTTMLFAGPMTASVLGDPGVDADGIVRPPGSGIV